LNDMASLFSPVSFVPATDSPINLLLANAGSSSSSTGISSASSSSTSSSVADSSGSSSSNKTGTLISDGKSLGASPQADLEIKRSEPVKLFSADPSKILSPDPTMVAWMKGEPLPIEAPLPAPDQKSDDGKNESRAASPDRHCPHYEKSGAYCAFCSMLDDESVEDPEFNRDSGVITKWCVVPGIEDQVQELCYGCGLSVLRKECVCSNGIYFDQKKKHLYSRAKTVQTYLRNVHTKSFSMAIAVSLALGKFARQASKLECDYVCGGKCSCKTKCKGINIPGGALRGKAQGHLRKGNGPDLKTIPKPVTVIPVKVEQKPTVVQQVVPQPVVVPVQPAASLPSAPVPVVVQPVVPVVNADVKAQPDQKVEPPLTGDEAILAAALSAVDIKDSETLNFEVDYELPVPAKPVYSVVDLFRGIGAAVLKRLCGVQIRVNASVRYLGPATLQSRKVGDEVRSVVGRQSALVHEDPQAVSVRFLENRYLKICGLKISMCSVDNNLIIYKRLYNQLVSPSVFNTQQTEEVTLARMTRAIGVSGSIGINESDDPIHVHATLLVAYTKCQQMCQQLTKRNFHMPLGAASPLSTDIASPKSTFLLYLLAGLEFG